MTSLMASSDQFFSIIALIFIVSFLRICAVKIVFLH